MNRSFSVSSSDIGMAGIMRCRLGSRDQKNFPEADRDARTRLAFAHPNQFNRALVFPA
jgi:hypothetical protein